MLGVLAVLLLAGPGVARAAATSDAASDWADNEFTSVRLVAAQDSIDRDGPLRFGLEFRMVDDWKVYWRSPGDAGYPPQPDWSRSENVAQVDMAWPAPERFSVLGLETLGYKHGVIFPLSVTPASRGALTLAADVDYLACSDICVPESVSLSLTLDPGPGGISRYAHDINQFVSLVPGDGSAHGLSIARAAVTDAAAPVLVVDAASVADLPFDKPDLFVEGPAPLSFGAPKVSIDKDGKAAHFEIPVYAPQSTDIALAGADVTLTLVDGRRVAEASLPVGVAETPAPAMASAAGIGLAILGLAFLGGLILNLMPCVLPVLSIKLLSVVKHGGGHAPDVRRGFIATAAGIVASFMLLAGGLSALKLSGAAVGWGIQFQQPVFLSAMAAVVTVFACNLWGWFEIRMPGFLGSLGAGKPGSLRGHFLTGMLATLLATPCSAPFLGTAVGFALARGPQEIVVIFAAIGAGLAAPYLAVAAVPSLATALPKPGHWMITFRRVLGFALAATAVWLLSVLHAGAGTATTMMVGAALVAVCYGFWALHRTEDPQRRPFIEGATGLALLIAAGIPAVAEPESSSGNAARETRSEARIDSLWQPFERERIAEIVSGGGTVFVDVTADWCLTCKVNKAVVMSDETVAARLGGANVTAMIADWTLPDPKITDYLASYGRYGIPFNAVYGPGAPDGIALPELLTPDAVLDALDRAAAPPS